MIKVIPLALATLATTTLFVGSQVIAQPAPEPVEMTRASVEQRANAAFERLDANGDGMLNQADREAMERKRFDQTDTDGNGQLSFAEVTAAREARSQASAERRAELGDRPAMRGPMRRGGPDGAQGAGRRGGRMIQAADTDNNGTVSQEEFTGHALARFDRADANGDGTITADERRSGRGERRHSHRQRG